MLIFSSRFQSLWVHLVAIVLIAASPGCTIDRRGLSIAEGTGGSGGSGDAAPEHNGTSGSGGSAGRDSAQGGAAGRGGTPGQGGSTPADASAGAGGSVGIGGAAGAAGSEAGVGGEAGNVVPTAALALTPTMKDFGTVPTGSSASQIFTVTNTGAVPTGTITAALSGAASTNFLVTASTCTGPLSPAATCNLTLSFSPATPLGGKTATLSALANPGGEALAALSGTATAPVALAFSPGAKDFTTIDVSTSTTASTFTLTNNAAIASGVVTVTKTGDTTQFTILDGCTGQNLIPSASCTVQASFAPTTQGMKTLTVSAQGAAGGDPAVLTLVGKGRDPVALTITTSGAGTGAVTSSPAGISCPGTCSATFDRNTVVSLTATPSATSSTFGSWSNGITSTTNPAMVTVDAAKTVNASFNLKSFALQVTNTSIGGGTGTVRSVSTPTPALEIDCGSVCNVSFDYNTMVTLTATPSAGSYFGGWDGDCLGSGASLTCLVPMTAAHNVTAKFTAANVMFSTATTYTVFTLASLGTGANQTLQVLDGADKACQAAASAAGLANSASFVAWLSASTRPAPSHIPAAARGWVRTDGRPFADSIASLIGPHQVFYPPYLDENGATTPGEERVWSSTLADGTAYQASAACQDYTSTSSADFAATGERSAGALGWTNENLYGQITCNMPARLYCFGTAFSAIVPHPTPPANGRYVFISAAIPDVSAGLASLDALCMAEKGSLPGTYRALVAPAGATPGSRFVAHGVPVVRPDGVVVKDLDTDFLANTLPLRAPVDVEAGGAYNMGYVRTGSTSPAVAGAATCNNWSNATVSFTGTTGFFSVILGQWFNLTNYTCDLAINAKVYCLQE